MKTNFSPCVSAFLMEREERARSGIFDYMSKDDYCRKAEIEQNNY